MTFQLYQVLSLDVEGRSDLNAKYTPNQQVIIYAYVLDSEKRCIVPLLSFKAIALQKAPLQPQILTISSAAPYILPCRRYYDTYDQNSISIIDMILLTR